MLEIINTLEPFFEDTTREVSIREFGRLKKIAPVTAGKVLKELEKQSLLRMREDRGYILFRLNSENYSIRKLGSIYWREKLIKLIEELNLFYKQPTIILFGSLDKCENNLQSDIDLAVISEKIKEFDNLEKFERLYKREIQLFNMKKVSDLKNESLAKNVLNGTKLSGSLEWI